MKKALGLFICMVFFGLSFTGCDLFSALPDSTQISDDPDASPSPSSAVVIPDESENVLFGIAWSRTDHYNPYSDEQKLNQEMSGLVYEGLFFVGTDFEPEPCLCESYTVSDATFTFALRQDVTFHDGSALTAQDVVYSLQLAAQDGSVYADRLVRMLSVDATDDFTVQLTLSEPLARFPALLDIPIIKSGSADQATIPGTGPYYLYIGADDCYLQEYPGWWQQKQLPQHRIILVAVTDAASLIYQFESDAVGLVEVDPTATNPLGLRGDCEVWDYPTSTLQYLGFNTRRQPLDDPVVRAAIGFAVDRETIAENIFYGHAVPAYLPVPPSSPLYSALLAGNLSYDLSRLSVLLSETGIADEDENGILDYADGYHRQDIILDLIVNSENTGKVNAARKIADALRSVGLSVSVRELKWTEFTAALQSGDFDLYYGEVTLSADFCLDFLLHSPNASQGLVNYGVYENEETDALLAAFAAQGTRSGAAALYARLQTEAPIVPVIFKNHSVYTRRGQIAGITSSQNNLFYDFPGWTIEK